MYWLEARKFPYYRNKRSTSINRTAWSNLAPSIEEPNFDWEVLYNGTGNSVLHCHEETLRNTEIYLQILRG